MSLIFYDFETTGLDPFQSKITQFMFLNSKEQKLFSSYVNPQCEIPPEVIKLNGVTWDDLKSYKTFSEQLDSIINFVGIDKPVYLVAHNGDSFDKIFLLNEMKRKNIQVPKNWYFIDTLKLAREFLPQLQKHNMDTLRDYYNLSKDYAHLATKDVLDLEKIYFNLAGDKTPYALYLLNKKLSQQMPFGKYKGVSLEKIPEEYFQFLISKKIITEQKNYDLFENLRQIFVK